MTDEGAATGRIISAQDKEDLPENQNPCLFHKLIALSSKASRCLSQEIPSLGDHKGLFQVWASKILCQLAYMVVSHSRA